MKTFTPKTIVMISSVTVNGMQSSLIHILGHHYSILLWCFHLLLKHFKDAWSVYQSTDGLIVKILTWGLTYTCGNAVKQGENSNRFPLLCCNWRIQLGWLLKQTIKSRMSQWWEENCPVWLVFWERRQPAKNRDSCACKWTLKFNFGKFKFWTLFRE